MGKYILDQDLVVLRTLITLCHAQYDLARSEKVKAALECSIDELGNRERLLNHPIN